MTSAYDEICIQEDKKVFDMINYVVWMTSAQRHKGNILRFEGYLVERHKTFKLSINWVVTKRKMFRWFIDWAVTKRKSDYAKFR